MEVQIWSIVRTLHICKAFCFLHTWSGILSAITPTIKCLIMPLLQPTMSQSVITLTASQNLLKLCIKHYHLSQEMMALRGLPKQAEKKTS